MGDFNDIRSKTLDQSKEDSKRTRTLPLLTWLENSNYEDTFRLIHPYKREYTWSNGRSNSRLDYIWASKDLSQGIIECKISDAEYITGSDHKIVLTQFITEFRQKSRSNACTKRMKGKKCILKLEKATEEEWEAYIMKLDKMLKEKLAASSEEDSIVIQSEKKSIDELWDIIARCILSSAYK